MAAAKRFEDLDVWQRAKELSNLIYRYSAEGAFAREFGLRDQMRRAAVSIVSNVAEGLERQTRSMFIQYLGRTKARRESCAPGFILHMNKAIFPKMNSGMYLLLPKCAVNKWQNLFNTSKLNPILVASGKME